MDIVKQTDLRKNLKKYFDDVCNGKIFVIPRKDYNNVVILSEKKYKQMKQVYTEREFSKKIDNSWKEYHDGKFAEHDLIEV